MSDHDNTSFENISDLGTPRRAKDNSADSSMEPSTSEPNSIEAFEKSMKDDIFRKRFILENLEKLSNRKLHSGRKSDITSDKLTQNTTDSRFLHGDREEHLPEVEYCKMDGHIRRLSTESIGSDLSSVRASEVSNLAIASLFGDGLYDLPENTEAPGTLDSLSSDLKFRRDLLVLFLSDERHKLKRVLNTVQRRLATAKTDLEDLIARLNQEVAVRQFLATKVFSTIVRMCITHSSVLFGIFAFCFGVLTYFIF